MLRYCLYWWGTFAQSQFTASWLTSQPTVQTGRTAVNAARIKELRVKSRRVTREVAISTTMWKWKLLFVTVTNTKARFPLRHNSETWSKVGQGGQWHFRGHKRAACNVVTTSHLTLKFSTHGTSLYMLRGTISRLCAQVWPPSCSGIHCDGKPVWRHCPSDLSSKVRWSAFEPPLSRKHAGAWSSQLTYIQHRRWWCVELCLQSPPTLPYYTD